MADVTAFGYGMPLTPAQLEEPTDFNIYVRIHCAILAILCYSHKQHFAIAYRHACFMQRTPINQALAENLDHYMKKKGWVQKTLAAKCGVAQTTISLYLHPERRKLGKDGKPGSAKLTEVEMLADVLEVDPWALIRPLSPTERAAYEQIEAAFKALRPGEKASAAELEQRSTAGA